MWTLIEKNAAVHIIPTDDLIDHEFRRCVCRPYLEGVPTRLLGIRWKYVHSSLDGRELKE